MGRRARLIRAREAGLDAGDRATRLGSDRSRHVLRGSTEGNARVSMTILLWLAIPLAALIIGIVWAYVLSRPPRPAAMQESMESFSRFRTALATHHNVSTRQRKLSLDAGNRATNRATNQATNRAEPVRRRADVEK